MFETSAISLDPKGEGLLSRGDLISRSSLEDTLTLWVPLKEEDLDEELSFDPPL